MFKCLSPGIATLQMITNLASKAAGNLSHAEMTVQLYLISLGFNKLFIIIMPNRRGHKSRPLISRLRLDF